MFRLFAMLGLFAVVAGCNSKYATYSATTDGMAPTITIGQKIKVDTAAYAAVTSIKRWDIVCYEWADSKRLTCKRVVGLPGETISWSPTSVRLNDEPLAIPEAFAIHLGTLSGPQAESGRVAIPDGHIFVVGDRVSGSKDSRYDGPVDFVLVRGKVVAIDGSPAQ